VIASSPSNVVTTITLAFENSSRTEAMALIRCLRPRLVTARRNSGEDRDLRGAILLVLMQVRGQAANVGADARSFVAPRFSNSWTTPDKLAKHAVPWVSMIVWPSTCPLYRCEGEDDPLYAATFIVCKIYFAALCIHQDRVFGGDLIRSPMTRSKLVTHSLVLFLDGLFRVKPTWRALPASASTGCSPDSR
jgi:hypothetical protein